MLLTFEQSLDMARERYQTLLTEVSAARQARTVPTRRPARLAERARNRLVARFSDIRQGGHDLSGNTMSHLLLRSVLRILVGGTRADVNAGVRRTKPQSPNNQAALNTGETTYESPSHHMPGLR